MTTPLAEIDDEDEEEDEIWAAIAEINYYTLYNLN